MTDVVQTPSIEIVASVDVETVFGSESVTTVIETGQRPDVIVVTQAADVIATAQPHTVVEASERQSAAVEILYSPKAVTSTVLTSIPEVGDSSKSAVNLVAISLK